MSENASEISIRPPRPDKPGYLRRQRELAGIQKRMRTEGGEEPFDAMIDFVLRVSEVDAPPGVDARDALMDLSEEQFDAIAEALGGKSRTVDPRSAA